MNGKIVFILKHGNLAQGLVVSHTWWHHQMETFSELLAICAGNSPVPVNSPHKGRWRGALMFSLICAWINDRVNNREAGDLRRHRGHYDVIVMTFFCRCHHHPLLILTAIFISIVIFITRHSRFFLSITLGSENFSCFGSAYNKAHLLCIPFWKLYLHIKSLEHAPPCDMRGL